MALSKELEALMVELDKADPVAAKEQRALLEKYPSLQKPTQEGVMRQSDYDRKHNEDKAQIEYGKTMKEWADRNQPKYAAMETERNEAIEKAKKAEEARVKAEQELAKKVDTAAAAAGVDPEKLAEAVRLKIGGDYVPKSEMTKLISDAANKLVEDGLKSATDKFYANDVPRLAGLNAALTEGINRFHDEFKDHLDVDAYTAHLAASSDKYMTDGKFDRKKTKTWLNWAEANHLSWANWNITDKDETTAILLPGAPANGGWTDDQLTFAGLYIRGVLRDLNK